MTKVKAHSSSDSQRSMRPALTIEARENQMIALAVDLAEKQLREGTASSQVITHYLKLGTTKADLEKERLIEENKLLRAKTESLERAKSSEELYANAIKAFRDYNGYGNQEEENYDDY